MLLFLFAGSIPPELGNLAALQCLDLQTNKLSGASGGERVDRMLSPDVVLG